MVNRYIFDLPFFNKNSIINEYKYNMNQVYLYDYC